MLQEHYYEMYSELIEDVKHSSMLQKLQDLDYATFFYLSLCNNVWRKNSIKNSFSFREAAGWVAFLREQDEDYLAFYPATAEYQEGFIRPDIQKDLEELNWVPCHQTFTDL